VAGVEAHQAVPERGDADRLDVVVAGRPHDGVQAGCGGLEELRGVVLDTAVAGGDGLVGHLVEAAVHGSTPSVVERRPRR
jgi:hypothetical protein